MKGVKVWNRKAEALRPVVGVIQISSLNIIHSTHGIPSSICLFPDAGVRGSPAHGVVFILSTRIFSAKIPMEGNGKIS